MDAVILAGEKEGAIPVLGMNKAFLQIDGKTIIARVIEAVDRAESVKSITVVCPTEKLGDRCREIKTEKPLKLLEQKSNIFENIWEGGVSTFEHYRPGMKPGDLAETPDADKPVLVLMSDMPLLHPAEVDHFVDTAPLDRADMIFGVTTQDVLKPYEPAGDDPGIKFIYIVLRDYIIRHANILCFRPAQLARVMETYVPLVYSIRYQRHWSNMARAFFGVLRFSLNFPALKAFLSAQAASYAHNHNRPGARDFFRKPLELSWAESVASKTVQTRFAVNFTVGPGTTLDVDEEESYKAFAAMFGRWQEMQAEQLKAAGVKTDY